MPKVLEKKNTAKLNRWPDDKTIIRTRWPRYSIICQHIIDHIIGLVRNGDTIRSLLLPSFSPSVRVHAEREWIEQGEEGEFYRENSSLSSDSSHPHPRRPIDACRDALLYVWSLASDHWGNQWGHGGDHSTRHLLRWWVGNLRRVAWFFLRRWWVLQIWKLHLAMFL